jgi:hypothetical protein
MPEMLLSGMKRGLLILVCFALLAQPAIGQDRTPTPSGEELWKTYPLHPSPTPGAASTAVPSPTAARTEKRRSGTAPDRSDSSPTAWLVVIALAAVLVVLAVVLLRHRRTAVQDSNDPAPQPPPDAADQAPQADPDPSGSPPTAPPDPLRPWTATIQWRHADAESRFCVVAEPAQGHGETVLATSEPLEWPPTTPASVQALTDATEKLAAALASVGWQELPHTGEWYAKRFAWEPEPSAPRSESGRYAEHVVR